MVILVRFLQNMNAAAPMRLHTLPSANSTLTIFGGYEDGEYFAVDFGGTNVRIILYEVSGKEIVEKKVKKFERNQKKRRVKKREREKQKREIKKGRLNNSFFQMITKRI